MQLKAALIFYEPLTFKPYLRSLLSLSFFHISTSFHFLLE